ncbi:MAG TPA: iron-sulfur cluster carrier protein ApbC [Gammaproteobacteria bacterium]|nr:iron-sulfur cluster carrier protein ApbC [Gammaproteobacteria bacterium]|tara:strand:- start:1158 stop:2246 length:1089 start_codon:yes stop_codon:yes gene_type:complete
MPVTQEQISAVIESTIDPYLGIDLVAAGAINSIKIDDNSVRIEIELGFPVARYAAELENTLRSRIADLRNDIEVEFDIRAKITAHAVQHGTKRLTEVRNIVAVASGKGGVGKSTTATNLALAMRDEGARVAILDADIYGPSQPRMLGAQGKPESRDGKSMEPIVSYGIQSISIGNLIEEDTPMIWRGPMVTGALEQLLNDTNWSDIDYLIIDLPPGTGDIQLTLCQKIPVSGAVIVTTPQDIALLDARKALKMFEKVDVPVLGIIENMSVHICSSCGNEEHIFGAGGGESIAQQYGIDMLGSLPLDTQIRAGVDNGKPTVALQPDSRPSHMYREIARRVSGKLALRAKDYSAKFPNIVVQNN